MNRKNSIIFIIVIVVLIPSFGWLIWNEFGRVENDFQKQIESSVPKNYSASGKAIPPQPQATSNASVPSDKTPAPVEETPMEKLESEGEEKKTDATQDWKTYQDTKDKFEFKYPPAAQVSDNGDFIAISQEDKTWKIRIYNNKKKEELEAWFNGYFDEKERVNCAFSESTVKVGTYETKYINPNSKETACELDGYYSANTEKTKVVKVKIGKETAENVNKILETFKFD